MALFKRGALQEALVIFDEVGAVTCHDLFVVVFFQGVDGGMALSKRGALQEALVIFDEVGGWCYSICVFHLWLCLSVAVFWHYTESSAVFSSGAR
jgi:hypothetical protein